MPDAYQCSQTIVWEPVTAGGGVNSSSVNSNVLARNAVERATESGFAILDMSKVTTMGALQSEGTCTGCVRSAPLGHCSHEQCTSTHPKRQL